MARKRIAEPGELPPRPMVARDDALRLRFDRAVGSAGFTLQFAELLAGRGSVASVMAEIRGINASAGKDQGRYLSGALAVRMAFRDLPDTFNKDVAGVLEGIAGAIPEMTDAMAGELVTALGNAAGKKSYMDRVEAAVRANMNCDTRQQVTGRMAAILENIRGSRESETDAGPDSAEHGGSRDSHGGTATSGTSLPITVDGTGGSAPLESGPGMEARAIQRSPSRWLVAAGALAVTIGIAALAYVAIGNLKKSGETGGANQTAPAALQHEDGGRKGTDAAAQGQAADAQASEDAASPGAIAREGDATVKPAQRTRRAPLPEPPSYDEIVVMLEAPLEGGDDAGEGRAQEVAAAIGKSRHADAERVLGGIWNPIGAPQADGGIEDSDEALARNAFMVSVLRRVALGKDSQKAIAAITRLGGMAGESAAASAALAGLGNEARVRNSPKRAEALRAALEESGRAQQ
jgi:hypothetical protein